MDGMTTRTEPPGSADEQTLLAAFLDFLRSTLPLKCAGLSEQQARQQVLPSPRTTLAGLVWHLRWLEHFWFEVVLAGQLEEAPWTAADPDADWNPPAERPIGALLAEYAAACARSRQVAAGLPLDFVADHPKRPVSLRWVLMHMIEETARHAGHADVVRELIDGVGGG